jgi:hypothetical protein
MYVFITWFIESLCGIATPLTLFINYIKYTILVFSFQPFCLDFTDFAGGRQDRSIGMVLFRKEFKKRHILPASCKIGKVELSDRHYICFVLNSEHLKK